MHNFNLLKDEESKSVLGENTQKVENEEEMKNRKIVMIKR